MSENIICIYETTIWPKAKATVHSICSASKILTHPLAAKHAQALNPAVNPCKSSGQVNLFATFSTKSPSTGEEKSQKASIYSNTWVAGLCVKFKTSNWWLEFYYSKVSHHTVSRAFPPIHVLLIFFCVSIYLFWCMRKFIG